MNPTENAIDSITASGAELARYRLSSGERVLVGWRRRAGIEVTDRPSGGRGRGHLVDRGFCSSEQLAAFVTDYLAEARRLDRCPMSAEALAAILAETDSEALDSLLGERA